MAQVRSPSGPAQSNSCGTCLRVARTLARPSSASSRSIATAVWVALCGSTPMITAMSTSLGTPSGWDPRGHSCFRSSVHVPLSSHPRRGLRRDALRSTANRSTTSGRHFVSHPARDLETLRTSRRAHPESQAGNSGTRLGPHEACMMRRRVLGRCATRAVDLRGGGPSGRLSSRSGAGFAVDPVWARDLGERPCPGGVEHRSC
jgi:hypothetical protein